MNVQYVCRIFIFIFSVVREILPVNVGGVKFLIHIVSWEPVH